MSVANQIAQNFAQACKREGFYFQVRNDVVSVAKAFTPEDGDAFTACDMTAPVLLAMLAARGGSQWGTDGGSVGGAAALKRGAFVLNQSGVPKRVIKALASL